jgi:hypothetical protein
MAQTASQVGTQPRSVSFKATIQILSAFYVSLEGGVHAVPFEYGKPCHRVRSTSCPR